MTILTLSYNCYVLKEAAGFNPRTPTDFEESPGQKHKIKQTCSDAAKNDHLSVQNIARHQWNNLTNPDVETLLSMHSLLCFNNNVSPCQSIL